ncbi:MAG: TRAP transporter substrate-binding protein [Deltaproteobacteria bacterium]|jgi:TRAP-type C4-dicarboxylate transport system substrate-binding protein|nr:TRAP transporter substrate-binding protein [Deltaproteobacteria bacterium]
MNKIIATIIGLSAASMLMISVASAKTTLRLSNWIPPKHPIAADMIFPWAKKVEKASNGRIKVNILKKALGKPPAAFDLAKDGIADISWGVHGYTPGRFAVTQLVELPFLGDDAEALSVAYWRVHQKYLAAANEHSGVKLLGLMTHGPGHIYNSKRAINMPADLEGLKIRVGGGVVSDVGKALNIVTMLKPATKSYEILSRGVADGIFFPKESIRSFKLSKVLKYATYVPGGLYNTSFFLVMSEKAWNKLSAEDQQAVMSVSGEEFAKLAGKGWNKADRAGVAAMQDAGMSLQTASSAMMAELRNKLSDIEAKVVARAKAKGIDGAAVLKMLRAEAASY